MSRQNKQTRKLATARVMSDRRTVRSTALDWKGKRREPLVIAQAVAREKKRLEA